MQITERERECVCMGKPNCSSEVRVDINLDGVCLHLCSTCATQLYRELGKKIVPKSIKSKFNLYERGK